MFLLTLSLQEGATVDYCTWPALMNIVRDTYLRVGYHRSVFVLMLSDQVPRILMENGGIEYVIKLFKESLSGDTPTKKDKLMAKDIISNLRKLASSDRISAAKTMLDYAYKWKDLAMWKDLIQSYDLQAQGEDGLARAWRVFKFDQTRARYTS